MSAIKTATSRIRKYVPNVRFFKLTERGLGRIRKTSTLTTGSMPLLVDVSSPRYHQPSSQHVPGIDYLSRIWHNFLEF